MKRIISIIIVSIVFTISLFAQAPQSFNYQAVARDNSGNILANKNIAIKISILDGSISGTAQYVETQKPQTNQFGLFTLEIGNGSVVSGTFAGITWASGSKFIKIEIDANNGTNYSLVGTSQLLSVPYALYAGNGSQWKKSGSDIFFNSGKVGINTNTPISPMHVGILPTTDRNPIGLLVKYEGFGGNYMNFVSGESGSTITFSGGLWFRTNPTISSTNFTDLGILTKGGFLGIGTTEPTSKIQVVGLPEYADNATAKAGGLTVGAFYRTGDLLKVVH